MIYGKAISTQVTSPELNLEAEHSPPLRGGSMSQKEFMIGKRQGETVYCWDKNVFSRNIVKWLYFLKHAVTPHYQIIVTAHHINIRSKRHIIFLPLQILNLLHCAYEVIY